MLRLLFYTHVKEKPLGTNKSCIEDALVGRRVNEENQLAMPHNKLARVIEEQPTWKLGMTIRVI